MAEEGKEQPAVTEAKQGAVDVEAKKLEGASGDAGAAPAPALVPVPQETPPVTPSLLAKIKRQVEFYFGDANFRKDNFLKNEAAKDPDGFVKVSVLLTFNRLKSMTMETSVVLNAIAGSETVKVNEAKDAIARTSPLPEHDDTGKRTVYIKGFGFDNQEVTIEFVNELLAGFGTVKMVRLRRNPKKKFLGSVFVEMATEEEVKALCARKEEIKYKGKPLWKVFTMAEYFADKEEEAKKYPKGRNAPDRKGKKDDKSKGEASPADEGFTKGQVIKLMDLPAGGLPWLSVKEGLSKFGKVAFVEMPTGKTEGFARMADPADAAKAVESLKDGMEVAALPTQNKEAKDKAEEEPASKKAKVDEQASDAVGEKKTDAGEGQTEQANKDAKEKADDAEKAANAEGQKAVIKLALVTGEEEEAYWKEARKAMADAAQKKERGGGRGQKRGRDGDNKRQVLF
ncbi:unnamed protein product [Chrysoparadoxa australica]